MIEEWSLEELKKRYLHHGTYLPDLTPSPELSYLLGVRYGDMGFGVRLVLLKVKSRDFAEEFARCAGMVVGKEYEVKPTKEGYYKVQVNSIVLNEFLSLPLEDHHEWIKPFPADFLRGFFDSEGNPFKQPGINLAGSDKELLYYVSGLLSSSFGIRSSVTTPPHGIERVGRIVSYNQYGKPIVQRKVSHCLYITGLSNVERFLHEIGFSIQRKNDILARGLYIDSHPRWKSKYMGGE